MSRGWVGVVVGGWLGKWLCSSFIVVEKQLAVTPPTGLQVGGVDGARGILVSYATVLERWQSLVECT